MPADFVEGPLGERRGVSPPVRAPKAKGKRQKAKGKR
jgi:hypothetical protein